MQGLDDDPILPPGPYDIVVAHSIERESKATGRPFTNLTVVVLGGLYEGTVIDAALSHVDRAAFVWEELAEHPRDIKRGQRAIAEVEPRTWEGVTCNRVCKLSDPSPPKVIKRFGRRYILDPKEES